MNPSGTAVKIRRAFTIPNGNRPFVFFPDTGFMVQTDPQGAKQFKEIALKNRALEPDVPSERPFAPTRITISSTQACGQRCVYCYGTPAHRMPQLIDPGFCEAGLRFIASHAKEQNVPMVVIFHGVGEPTLHWERFAQCVGLAERVACESAVQLTFSICTGGQLSKEQADFLAAHFQEISVSLDGPADIQRKQRPRKDGGDSFAPALQTAQIARQAGKKISIGVSVTEQTVSRMSEIVDWIGSELGIETTVVFGDIAPLPWVDPAEAAAPDPERFVQNFLEALDRGARLGVQVQHADISLSTLFQRQNETHLCLTPFNRVTAFYDTPLEGAAEPEAGCFGTYDPTEKTIRWDHAKRKAMEVEESHTLCAECICRNACGGRSAVRGKLPADTGDAPSRCFIRRTIAKALLWQVAEKKTETKRRRIR